MEKICQADMRLAQSQTCEPLVVAPLLSGRTSHASTQTCITVERPATSCALDSLSLGTQVVLMRTFEALATTGAARTARACASVLICLEAHATMRVRGCVLRVIRRVYVIQRKRRIVPSVAGES
eukprot:4265920-Pleurochrysis_carterae.AAC.2